MKSKSKSNNTTFNDFYFRNRIKIVLVYNIIVVLPLILTLLHFSIKETTLPYKDKQIKDLKKHASFIYKTISNITTKEIDSLKILDYCGYLNTYFNNKEISFYYFKTYELGDPCKGPSNLSDDNINQFLEKKKLFSNDITKFPKGENPLLKDMPSLVYSYTNQRHILVFGTHELDEPPLTDALKDTKTLLYNVLLSLLNACWINLLFVLFVDSIFKTLTLKSIQKIDLGPYGVLLKCLRFLNIEVISETQNVTSASLDYNTKQKKELELYRTDLPKQLDRLLLLGKIAIPFNFRAVLAAADINDFSRIKNDKNALELYKCITEFLDTLLHDLSVKFGASHCHFGGDLVQGVFYGENSHHRAYDFIRTVIMEFNKKEFIYNGKPIKLHFKSSIREVDLTYQKRKNGKLDIGGFDMILFTDIFKSYKSDEKYESRIAIETKEINNYRQLFSEEHIVSEDGTYTKLNNFHRIEYIFKNNLDQINNFISDDEITFLLKQIQDSNDIEIVTKIISTLHKIHLVYSDTEIYKELKKSLLILKDRATIDEKWTFQYTKLLSTVNRLLSKKLFVDLGGVELVLFHFEGANQRIQATVATVLNDFELPEEVLGKISSKYSPNLKRNLRLEGEIIRAEAMIRLGNKTIGKLYKLLKNDESRNTGIYYTFKIFSYFMEENPSALLIFSNYYKCIEFISKLQIEDKDDRLNNLIDSILTIHRIVLNPSNTQLKSDYYLNIENIFSI